jgi:hypothetical protein
VNAETLEMPVSGPLTGLVSWTLNYLPGLLVHHSLCFSSKTVPLHVLRCLNFRPDPPGYRGWRSHSLLISMYSPAASLRNSHFAHQDLFGEWPDSAIVFIACRDQDKVSCRII